MNGAFTVCFGGGFSLELIKLNFEKWYLPNEDLTTIAFFDGLI